MAQIGNDIGSPITQRSNAGEMRGIYVTMQENGTLDSIEALVQADGAHSMYAYIYDTNGILLGISSERTDIGSPVSWYSFTGFGTINLRAGSSYWIGTCADDSNITNHFWRNVVSTPFAGFNTVSALNLSNAGSPPDHAFFSEETLRGFGVYLTYTPETLPIVEGGTASSISSDSFTVDLGSPTEGETCLVVITGPDNNGASNGITATDPTWKRYHVEIQGTGFQLGACCFAKVVGASEPNPTFSLSESTTAFAHVTRISNCGDIQEVSMAEINSTGTDMTCPSINILEENSIGIVSGIVFNFNAGGHNIFTSEPDLNQVSGVTESNSGRIETWYYYPGSSGASGTRTLTHSNTDENKIALTWIVKPYQTPIESIKNARATIRQS